MTGGYWVLKEGVSDPDCNRPFEQEQGRGRACAISAAWSHISMVAMNQDGSAMVGHN